MTTQETAIKYGVPMPETCIKLGWEIPTNFVLLGWETPTNFFWIERHKQFMVFTNKELEILRDCFSDWATNTYKIICPAPQVHEILSSLPKEIPQEQGYRNEITMTFCFDKWFVGYSCEEEIEHENLVEALALLYLHLKQNNFLTH
jgi:hypothetical protein